MEIIGIVTVPAILSLGLIDVD